MSDYTPNSHRYKAEQKAAAERPKLEKVVKGNVKVKKKSELSKFADVFISEDAANVKDYILMDVIVPTICKTIVDIVTDSVNMIFLGGKGRGSSRSSGGTYVSYNKYSNNDRRDDRYSRDSRRSAFDIDRIFFDSRGEVENLLSTLDDIMEEYKLVRVADFYDLAGVSCEHTANDYGWTNIRNARAVHTRDGWIAQMPRPIPLD